MGYTLEFRVCSISPEPFEGFSLNSNVPLSEFVCRSDDSAMQTQSKGHTSRSWYSALGDLAVLQTAVLLLLRIHQVYEKNVYSDQLSSSDGIEL